jgi:hypothetical protein
MRNLGYITPQITMSLGHSELSLIPNPDVPSMIGPYGLPQVRMHNLNEAPPDAPVSGTVIIFGVMLLGLGSALGFAMGVSHGVKLSSGGR